MRVTAAGIHTSGVFSHVWIPARNAAQSVICIIGHTMNPDTTAIGSEDEAITFAINASISARMDLRSIILSRETVITG